MLAQLIRKIWGTRNDKTLARYALWVREIDALEAGLEPLSLDELQAKTADYKQRHKNGESLESLLPEAFALVREVSRRQLGLRHFGVQLMGGMALHEGCIPEMATGEGKTLAATLPTYLNSLTGRPIHIVTVNDYLAQRDADWMRPIYEALGLTVGVVLPGQSREEKVAAYKCDILYATNNEMGFDYLRDRLVFKKEDQVQGDLYYAIVDEVDSILIDEARTPLIISGQAEHSSELYALMNVLAPTLLLGIDYTIDEKSKQSYLTEAGHQKVEEKLVEMQVLSSGQHLYEAAHIGLVHHLQVALRAHALFKRDVDYIVQDGQVVIIDEHTGRSMPGRRWSDGLHQAIEAKEGVPLQSENQTVASITFQNFFRLYTKLAGMTGTADTEAYELQQIYGLDVVVIPTNSPCQRIDHPDVIYLTKEEKFAAILQDVKDCVARQQPVLVGTIAIETSEYLSHLLTEANIPHQVLNAKFHMQEAQIIAEAGRPGMVTIATNMAGRGTDIVLGGNFNAEEKALGPDADPNEYAARRAAWETRHNAVLEAGGLHIIGTERHESRRIDNQLRGRSGRLGDPGSSRFYMSLEDTLMRLFASDKVALWMRKLGVQQGEAIFHPWVTRAIENAQRKVEGFNFDMRKQLLEYDNVANEQRQIVYEQRDQLLLAENFGPIIEGMMDNVLQAIVYEYMPAESVEDAWDVEGLEHRLVAEFGLNFPVQEKIADPHMTPETLVSDLVEFALLQYAQKRQLLSVEARHGFEKSVILHTLDNHWKEHLAAMEYLRQSIHLRGYAQKDPRQEYKREAFLLFSSLLEVVAREVVSLLLKIQVDTTTEDGAPVLAEEAPQSLTYHHASIAPEEAAAPESKVTPFARPATKKVGRNDVCPCGSGEKYKFCHGKLA